MKSLLRGLIGCLLVLPGVLGAADLPFGTDGLPYLSQRADCVVKISAPRLFREIAEADVVLISANVDEVIRGNRPSREQVILTIPIPLEREPSEMEGAMVFLHAALSEQEKAEFGVDVDEAVYRIVSGHNGVIPAAHMEAQSAAREYLVLPEGTELRWAEKYVFKEDELLARWGFLALDKLTGKDKSADDLLIRCLESKTLRTSHKIRVIEKLQSLELSKWRPLVEELIRDPAGNPLIRLRALKALLEKGVDRDSLRNLTFQESKEHLALAFATMLEAASVVGPLMDERATEILARLKSSNVNERIAASLDLGRCTPSKELIDALTDVVVDAEEQIQVKLAALKTLSSFKTKEAVKALGAISERSDEELVRKSALLSLARDARSGTIEAVREVLDGTKERLKKKLGRLPGFLDGEQ